MYDLALSISRPIQLFKPILLILLGFSLNFGLNHIFIWLKDKNKFYHPFFFLLSISVSLFILNNYALYSSATIEQYGFYIKLRDFIVPFFFISYVWFLSYYTNIKPFIFLRVLTLFWLSAFVMNFFYPNGYQVEEIKEIYQHTLSWGETITLGEAIYNGLGSLIYFSLAILSFSYTFYLSYILYKRKMPRSKLMSLIGLIWISILINDTLVDLKIINFIYLGEFGFLSVVFLLNSSYTKEWHTEINKKNKELEIEQFRFNNLVRNIPGAVKQCSMKDFSLMYISDQIEPITGYPVDFFMLEKKLSLRRIVIAEDIEAVEGFVVKAINSREPFIIEYRIKHRDNSVKWVIEYGQGYYNDKGAPLWIDSIIIDNTDKKLSEQEILKTRDELKRKYTELNEINTQLERYIKNEKEHNKLRKQFVNNINHELRNPLTAILLSVELLKENLDCLDKEQLLSQILHLEKSSSRLLELIEELLFLAKMEGGEMFCTLNKLSLEDVLKDLELFYKNLFNSKNLFFDININSNIELINDREHLNKIFSNLLNNSYKFTHEGGVVINARQNENRVFIDVSDTGTGIKESELGNIFNKFTYGSNKNPNIPGTGIGLNIVKTLSERHGGKVAVMSKENQGTTFTIELPKQSKWHNS